MVAINNLLLGGAGLGADAQWEVASNHTAAHSDFSSPATGDYRLRASSKLVGKAVDPGTANGVSLRLEREYAFPQRGRILSQGLLSPGAIQSTVP